MKCPECGREVLMIYHEWCDVATFEYHHTDDPKKEHPDLCTVKIPRGEGLVRFKKEWTEMYDKTDSV